MKPPTKGRLGSPSSNASQQRARGLTRHVVLAPPLTLTFCRPVPEIEVSSGFSWRLKSAFWATTEHGYGSTFTGTKNLVASVPAGASPTMSINMSNGTPATLTTSNQTLPIGVGSFAAFTRTPGGGGPYGINPTACVVVLAAIATSRVGDVLPNDLRSDLK